MECLRGTLQELVNAALNYGLVARDEHRSDVFRLILHRLNDVHKHSPIRVLTLQKPSKTRNCHRRKNLCVYGDASRSVRPPVWVRIHKLSVSRARFCRENDGLDSLCKPLVGLLVRGLLLR